MDRGVLIPMAWPNDRTASIKNSPTMPPAMYWMAAISRFTASPRQAASLVSRMTWSLIRPQSHRKIAWRIRYLSSGSTKAKLMGFTQPGQTGGRIGGGQLIFGIYTPGNTANNQLSFQIQIVFGDFLATAQPKYLSPQLSDRIKASKVRSSKTNVTRLVFGTSAQVLRPCAGLRRLSLRKLLIFDRHFEVAFLQKFRADVSHPQTFLCPLCIRLPLQHLHIPMKRCRHLVTPRSVWS